MTLWQYIHIDWHDTVSRRWYCSLRSSGLSKWNSIMFTRETDCSVFVWRHTVVHVCQRCAVARNVSVCRYIQRYILCWAQNKPTLQSASLLEALLHTSKGRLFSFDLCSLQMPTAVRVPSRLVLFGAFYCYLSILFNNVICPFLFYSYCMFKYFRRASWHSSATLTEFFPCFWRANVYSFVFMGSQHRKGVAYGVASGPTNRNTVTKASRRGVAT
jgi:hypothetical protein